METLKNEKSILNIEELEKIDFQERYELIKNVLLDDKVELLSNFLDYLKNNGQLNSELRIFLCKELNINSIKLLNFLIELKKNIILNDDEKIEKIPYNGILMNQGICGIRLNISKIGIKLTDNSHVDITKKYKSELDIGFLDELINRRCKVLDCASLESIDGCSIINDLINKIKNGTVEKIYNCLKEGKKLGKLKKIGGPINIVFMDKENPN